MGDLTHHYFSVPKSLDLANQFPAMMIRLDRLKTDRKIDILVDMPDPQV
jgi:hypothetical protein